MTRTPLMTRMPMTRLGLSVSSHSFKRIRIRGCGLVGMARTPTRTPSPLSLCFYMFEEWDWNSWDWNSKRWYGKRGYNNSEEKRL